jgi:plasmid stabilization system protein ParE
MTPASPFSPAALVDIRVRWRRLRDKASLRVADRFLESVQATGQMLVEFPHAGILCEVRSQRLGELRRFPVSTPYDNYLLIYSVRAERIVVLRVLHAAQDWHRFYP